MYPQLVVEQTSLTYKGVTDYLSPIQIRTNAATVELNVLSWYFSSSSFYLPFIERFGHCNTPAAHWSGTVRIKNLCNESVAGAKALRPRGELSRGVTMATECETFTQLQVIDGLLAQRT